MPWNNLPSANVASLAKVLKAAGVDKVVFSPGSRNAPLTLGFKRTGLFDLYPVADERAAGFIALGMRDAGRKPVVVITTSGSAVANLLPAVSEAFFREKEIILLTADRPRGEPGNWTGQTIYQQGIFGDHLVKELDFDLSDRSIEAKEFQHDLGRIQSCKGPVHINCHFSEPFYPEPGAIPIREEEFDFDKEDQKSVEADLTTLPSNNLPIFVLGQAEEPYLKEGTLRNVIDNHLGIVFRDITSNVPYLPGMITSFDLWGSAEDLPTPDLIVSFGRQILSKRLRKLLGENRLSEIHFGDERKVGNPFGSDQTVLNPPESILRDYFSSHLRSRKAEVVKWQEYEERKLATLNTQGSDHEFSEAEIYPRVLKAIPSGVNLHLANSMAVRFANTFQSLLNPDIRIYSNRGTSGIDGCLSTAVGASLADLQKTNYLLIGDQAFFYDINGLWHQNLPVNLQIILFNNGGGGIFELIEGPSAQPEFGELFYNNNDRTAENISADFGIDYSRVENLTDLGIMEASLVERTKGISIFEVFTEREHNLKAYSRLKNK